MRMSVPSQQSILILDNRHGPGHPRMSLRRLDACIESLSGRRMHVLVEISLIHVHHPNKLERVDIICNSRLEQQWLLASSILFAKPEAPPIWCRCLDPLRRVEEGVEVVFGEMGCRQRVDDDGSSYSEFMR